MPTRFDYSDSRYMTIYANDEPDHNHVEEIQIWFENWVKRMNTAEKRFGLLFINHAHEEHDEHDDEHDGEHNHKRERNEDEENAMTALAVKFRREYRTLANATTTGYATVFQGEFKNEEQRAMAQQRTNQFANYMFGIPGRMFHAEAEARAWLDTIADQPPMPLERETAVVTTKTTAIFYGRTMGSTEIIAERVQVAWGEAHGETPPIVNVGNMAELMKLLAFNQILIGVPPWNIGKLQDDWEIVYPYLDRVDLSGKQIAIFGVGDQFGYPENFQDAIGILGRKFQERGAQLVGYTSIELLDQFLLSNFPALEAPWNELTNLAAVSTR
ncbi:MAG: flavodoxin domain-containing protein [Chloroflexota bacterium]